MIKHRLIPVLAIAVIIITLQSCSQVAQKLKFNLSLQSQSVDFTIPATSLTTGTFTFGPQTYDYNVDSFIKAQTGTLLGVSNITDVHITSCVLTVNNPDSSDNLQNIESGDIQFSSNTNTTPYQINIPEIADVYATSINVPVDTTAELTSYYLGNQFSYWVSGKMRRATIIPLNCALHVTFNVTVQG